MAIFDFKDITTFNVTVMSADPKAENGAEVGADGTESGIDNKPNNVGEDNKSKNERIRYRGIL